MIVFLGRVGPDSRPVLGLQSAVVALSCVELNPGHGPSLLCVVKCGTLERATCTKMTIVGFISCLNFLCLGLVTHKKDLPADGPETSHVWSKLSSEIVLF